MLWHHSRAESLLWEMCQDAVCLAGIAQHFKNLDRWGAISWDVAFCWASKELKVEGGALYPVDIPVLLLAGVTANEMIAQRKEKKKKAREQSFMWSKKKKNMPVVFCLSNLYIDSF